jgi:aryl-alcohol dehydrogenase-like predicted oxidoreductase
MKLVLGTAQFGMDYGVTNNSGMCSSGEIEKILDFAFSKGITELDTAISYGKSEENLGVIGVKRFNVSSKIPYLVDYRQGDINQYVSASLKRLGISSLDILYLHDNRNLQNLDILADLRALKAAGKICKIGISIYASDAPDTTIQKVNEFDVVQCQGNAFDVKYLAHLNKSFSVYLRSVFLQGLLLADLDSLPFFLRQEKKLFLAWDKYCKSHGRSKLEMSLYNVTNNGLDGYVVGASSLQEFEQIILARDLVCLMRDVPLFKYDYVNEYVIDPRRWNK